MLIFTKIGQLRGYLSQIRGRNKTIGFVPTMGALHNGHISLIKASKDQCNYTICSIFVNPAQFNDKSDLEHYPRTPEKDIELLKKAYCDALFMPSVEEMRGGKTDFDFGYLDKILEGEHRPGHFNGVAKIVKQFFDVIEPDKAFFGSKDYQQVMIVKELVKQMNSPIEIVSCPILRESDGLAMSSRNELLSSDERENAGLIPGIMKEAAQIAIKEGVSKAKDFVSKKVASVPIMKLDYYEICDPDSLKPISTLKPGAPAVSLIAVFVGKIRLIDNLVLN
jgi:pantoate--beta-alanine ligase